MAIRFTCPNCDTDLKARDDEAGEMIRCSSCNTRVRVPDEAAEADERPSRRSRPRDEDDDDDRPQRRASSRNRDEDDEYDDDAPIIRPKKKSKMAGVTLTSLILSIIGLVMTILAGGPLVCGICCIFLLPVSWVLSILGGLLGLGGTISGFVAKDKHPHPANIWGIVLGILAVMGMITVIVIQVAFVAAVKDDVKKGGEELRKLNQQLEEEARKAREKQDQERDERNKAATRKTNAELVGELLGKTPDDVERIVGVADRKTGVGGNQTWTYLKLVRAPSGLLAKETTIVFRNNMVVSVTTLN